jgi:hypothetical protein
MANPTTNYGFVLPTSTDLVTDLPADFDVALQGVDTRLKALQPGTTLGDLAYSSATANTNTRLPIGTTGQVLTVSGGVPAWSSPNPGDITAVTAGTGLSGGGTSGDVTLSINTAVTADLTTAQTLTNKAFTSPEETVTVSATAATGTINFDFLTQGVLFYTSNATANFTLNFRGSSGATLNSIFSTGQAISGIFLNTNGSTAYYPTAFQIDGSSVTPKWSGGTAPAAGNASSIDSYSFTIIKTGSAAFTVLAGGAVKFA